VTNHIIKTGRLTDAALITAFNELTESVLDELSASSAGIRINIDDEEIQKNLAKSRARTITHIQAGSKSAPIMVQYLRGTSVNENDLTRMPSAYFDEFVVTVNRPDGNKRAVSLDEVQWCIRVAGKHATGVTDSALENRAETATALLQEQFSQLSVLQTDILERSQERRAQEEADYAMRRQALEQAADQREREFAETRTSELAAIEAQRAALDERAKELDDRGHMHVRRLLREQITNDIQDRLKKAMLPLRTSILRQGVFVLALIGAVFLGSLAYVSFIDYVAELQAVEASISAASKGADSAITNAALQALHTNAMWVALARGISYSIGTFALLLYAVSWLKRIYYDDVRAMRELERYSIDLNRASWAIETIMEAKSQGDVAIPDLLVAGVSKHLFDHPGQKENEGTSDALAAVLRASAKAKIGPGGAEFELNNRGTTKLAKELEE
jgi:hypothetical protein